MKRRAIVSKLVRAGFRSTGGTKDEMFVHPDGRRTVVARHAEVPKATVRKIEKQTGVRLVP